MESTKDKFTGLSGKTRGENNTEMDGEKQRGDDTGVREGKQMGNNTARGGETNMANMERQENQQQERQHERRGKKYLKEATVILNVDKVKEVRVSDIIKALTEKCGHGRILAIRPRKDKEYEITLEEEETCDKLIDGLTINEENCEVKMLQNRDYVVSFMHLPVYLEDSVILEKLDGWGVSPLSKIKRRTYPGTEIEDGTRFIKTRFPKEVASLPYSTKFETAEGPQYFRVMHSHQVKTCRLCMSPEHVMKDCPDFRCFKCEERGHFARNCDAIKCPECLQILAKCECWMEAEEGEERNQISRQVHKVNNVEQNEGEEQAGVLQPKDLPKEIQNGKEIQEDKKMHKRNNEDDIFCEERHEEERGKMQNEANERLILEERERQTLFKETEKREEEDNENIEMETMDNSQMCGDNEVKTGQRNEEKSNEIGREEEIKMDREERRTIRRRTLKIKPNLESTKRKLTTRMKNMNRYEVLKEMEGDDE